MKKISKIKLGQFSKAELDQRKMNVLKGGCGCSSGSCGCGCGMGTYGWNTADDRRESYNGNNTLYHY